VIVMTASSAQAQHFLPNPYRGAADAVFQREAQKRAEREAHNRAYVPPPPVLNATRLPRDLATSFPRSARTKVAA
jgi:hypothetical protein